MKDDRSLVTRLNAIIHNQRERIRHLEFVVAQMKRDRDGTATAALCEDMAVPKDCQARPSPDCV